jgi:glycosyltransferase involved in cell wall biosynthesis
VKLNFMCEAFNPYTGYGRLARDIMRYLLARGVDAVPMLPDQARWSGVLQRAAGIDFSRLTIALIPHCGWPSVQGRLWGFTMWETTTLPPEKAEEWVDNINLYCERLIVPCQWNADIFKNAGVVVPIHVVPLGIDPAEFPIVPNLPRNRPYTFMALGDRGNRKGHDLVWRAFFEAFKESDDVRLVIKCRKNDMLIPVTAGSNGKTKYVNILDLSNFDRRVSIWREDAATLADVYSAADCYAFPSRGEGWGYPPREAAAMGIPAIVSDYGGLAEGGAANYAIPIPCTESASPMATDGLWAQPDFEALVAAMRWCYDNPQAAKDRALQAANWIRKHQTLENAADVMMKLLETTS